MEDTLKELDTILNDIGVKTEEIFEGIDSDSYIDESQIDMEAIKVSRMQSKYNKLYLDEFNIYSDYVELKKEFKLERWKYYLGKQTNQYYRKYGNINESINKTDVDKYLDGDAIMSRINKITSSQKVLVDAIEKFSKELSDRGYRLRLLLDYRKFVSCV